METLVMLLLVGAVGGAVRSVLGYKTQADEGEKFDIVKFLKSVVRASIAGAFLIYSTFDLNNITEKTYVAAFFTSVGADVLIKEVYGSLTK